MMLPLLMVTCIWSALTTMIIILHKQVKHIQCVFSCLINFDLSIFQRSKCNNYKAVNCVNESHQHLKATGIGAVACTRHRCFFFYSVVDFQKGE